MEKQTSMHQYLKKKGGSSTISDKIVPSILRRKDPGSRQHSDAETQRCSEDWGENCETPAFHRADKEYCGLFFLVLPSNLTSWEGLRNQLEALSKKKPTKTMIMQFIQKQIHNRVKTHKADSINLGNLDKAGTSRFWEHTIPIMLKRAARGHLSAVKLLRSNNNLTVTMSKGEVLDVLIHMFLCTMPQQFFLEDTTFAQFYNQRTAKPQLRLEKLKCIVAYFQTAIERPELKLQTPIIYQRVSNKSRKYFQECLPMRKVKLSLGFIEQHKKDLMVDFANKVVGGGVLKSGCVQEEILFVTHPELILSTLLFQPLEDHECGWVHGCMQYANYEGYSESFKFKGKHNTEHMDLDIYSKLPTTFVIIDAVDYSRSLWASLKNPQVNEKEINRELHKAYLGFNCSEYLDENQRRKSVVTGKWGCGAFKGDPQLKLVIQWLACSYAKRDMIFINWNESDSSASTRQLQQLIESLQLLQTKEVRDILKRYCLFRTTLKSEISLTDYICDFYFV